MRGATKVRHVASLTTGVWLSLVGSALADTCCYYACGTGVPRGVKVVCAKKGDACADGVACGLWATKTTTVDCKQPSTCREGDFVLDEADALVERLAADKSLVVVRSVEFELKSGERVRFEE